MISFGPSQAKPPNGFANVCAPIAALVACPARRLVNSNVPSRARRRRLDASCRPPTGAATVTPGQAELALLDDARLAAAGLEVAPDDADDRRPASPAGCTACTAPFGTVGRRDAGERRAARRRPGASGVFSTMRRRRASPAAPGVEGNALREHAGRAEDARRPTARAR